MKNAPIIKSLLLMAVLLNICLLANYVAVPKLRQNLAVTIYSESDSITYEQAKNIADSYFPQL